MGEITLDGVREYGERLPVKIAFYEDVGRFVLKAENQGGYDCVEINLLDLVAWLKDGGMERNHIPQ